ncbi:MAG: glycosyltransferase [Endomicrobia bacterium]|nr:glycosyltransferase [Endomicrobiia bacterium]
MEAADILKDSFPNIKFIFVGDGPEKEKLVYILKSKKLNNVEFKNAIPKIEIIKLMSNMDALFFRLINSPVFKYGISSNKLFDYLASGKPIIFSSNSTNNLVEEAGAGITVPPDNPEELAKAIFYVYHIT